MKMFWKSLGMLFFGTCCAEFKDAEVTSIQKDNKEYAKKALKMLLQWKNRDASKATYRVLRAALSHKLVGRRDLAEKFCW